MVVWVDSFMDTLPGETPATETTETVDSSNDSTGQAPEQQDTAGLLKALQAEREARKAAEKRLKSAVRTDGERLQDLESEVTALRVEKMRNQAIDDAIAGLNDGYQVSRQDVLDTLQGVSLTAENAADMVRLRVEKLKRPKPKQTPELTNPAFNGGNFSAGDAGVAQWGDPLRAFRNRS